MTDRFYQELPDLPGFKEALSPDRLVPIPKDWWVVMTDVVGSTQAIGEGRYKDVNAAGSLAAMALANILGTMNFPFVFGGDGMTCLIPGTVTRQVRPVLAGLGQAVHRAFGLELRLAMIPLEQACAGGRELRCGAVRVSPAYRQAVLWGQAVAWCEKILKDPDAPFGVDWRSEPSQPPDLSGYSCRWQDYPSPLGETGALIVQCREPDVWPEVWKLLEEAGVWDHSAHPLRVSETRMSSKRADLEREVGLKAGGTRGWKAFWTRWYIRLEKFIVRLATRWNWRLLYQKKNLGEAVRENVRSSDVRKVENGLKLVAAFVPEKRMRLEKRLEELRVKGKIYWGLHVSNRALLTCLIQASAGEEVHFVDAADGGYALAMNQIKQQLLMEESH